MRKPEGSGIETKNGQFLSVQDGDRKSCRGVILKAEESLTSTETVEMNEKGTQSRT